jgi:hypothetical protein
VQRREVGGHLDGPRHDLVIMACPELEQWQLRGWGVVVDRGVLIRARGSR